MRRRIKPAGRWPTSSTYLSGKRNILDSRVARRQHSTHRPQSPQLGLRPCSPWPSCLRRCCKPAATAPRHLLLLPSRRRFSVSTPRRGDDDFDDDFDDFDDFGDVEDFKEKKQDLSSLIRQRSLEALQKQKLAKLEQEAQAIKELQARVRRVETILSGIEEFAKVELQELQRLAELLPVRKQQARQARFIRESNDLMSLVTAFDKVCQSSFEELFYIKYPEVIGVEAGLPSLRRTLEDYKSQYRACRSNLQICDLQSERASIEARVADVEQLLQSMANHIRVSLVAPQASARQNIDKVLQPKFEYLYAYLESQNAAHMVTTTSRHIFILLTDLASLSSFRSNRYHRLARRYGNPFSLNNALHSYRYHTRMSLFYRPLGETQVHRLAADLNRVGWETFGIERTPSTLEWPLTRTIASSLCYWYFPRWSARPPRDPELDITWRYLDVVHPFDVIRAWHTNIIQMLGSILNMLTTAESPLSIMNNRAMHDVVHRLDRWHKDYQLVTGMFEMEVTALRYITWVRLITESKIHALGEVPDTIERGLFCAPNPLSQDPRKFVQYTHTFASLTNLSTVNAREMRHRRLGIWNEKTERSAVIKLFDPNSKQSSRRSSKTTAPADRTHKRFVYAPSRAENIKGKKSTSEKPPSAERPRPSTKPRSSAEPSSSNLPETVARKGGRRIRRRRVSSTKITIEGQVSTAKTSTREYSTSSRNRSGWSLEEDLKSAVSGADEKSYPTVDEEVLVRSELRDSQPISSQSPTPPFDKAAKFWSHKNHQGQNGKAIAVHYCRTFESAERVAKLFSESRVIGFDLEWKAQASSTAGIKSNLSLIQIADENRIALFHVALFQTKNDQELTPPSLRKLLESADIVKVGVHIKADCTRVRRYLGIEVQSQLELSHLYKLVKHSQSNPKLINRRVVNLSQQVEEILGLPLYKEDNVRCSDWSRPLAYTQVQCESLI